jgi:hypothetical protein
MCVWFWETEEQVISRTNGSFPRRLRLYLTAPIKQRCCKAEPNFKAVLCQLNLPTTTPKCLRKEKSPRCLLVKNFLSKGYFKTGWIGHNTRRLYLGSTQLECLRGYQLKIFPQFIQANVVMMSLAWTFVCVCVCVCVCVGAARFELLPFSGAFLPDFLHLLRHLGRGLTVARLPSNSVMQCVIPVSGTGILKFRQLVLPFVRGSLKDWFVGYLTTLF